MDCLWVYDCLSKRLHGSVFHYEPKWEFSGSFYLPVQHPSLLCLDLCYDDFMQSLSLTNHHLSRYLIRANDMSIRGHDTQWQLFTNPITRETFVAKMPKTMRNTKGSLSKEIFLTRTGGFWHMCSLLLQESAAQNAHS